MNTFNTHKKEIEREKNINELLIKSQNKGIVDKMKITFYVFNLIYLELDTIIEIEGRMTM